MAKNSHNYCNFCPPAASHTAARSRAGGRAGGRLMPFCLLACLEIRDPKIGPKMTTEAPTGICPYIVYRIPKWAPTGLFWALKRLWVPTMGTDDGYHQRVPTMGPPLNGPIISQQIIN